MIAITVEEEEDIDKFKDYKPVASDAAPEPKETSTPSPPKEEAAPEPVTSKAPEVPKPSPAPATEGRIFASPLARRIAEEHKVYHCSYAWFLCLMFYFILFYFGQS